MALTPTQLTTLKADMDANHPAEVANGDAGALKAIYNTTATPDYWIFRSAVTSVELSEVIDLQDMADITSADSDRVIKIFTLRSLDGGNFDGRNPRTRSAFDDVFSAAAGDNSQQAIAALWQRPSSVSEELFALGTGTGADAANADTTAVEGDLSLGDMRAALSL